MTYYVSRESAAADTNAGTSPAAPWLSLNKVNLTTLAGDTVLFRCGDAWNGQISPLYAGLDRHAGRTSGLRLVWSHLRLAGVHGDPGRTRGRSSTAT